MEAATTESDTCAQKVRADTTVQATCMRDLVDIRARGLADGRDGIDRRNALRQQGIGSELAELATPETRVQDAFLRHPVVVQATQ